MRKILIIFFLILITTKAFSADSKDRRLLDKKICNDIYEKLNLDLQLKKENELTANIYLRTLKIDEQNYNYSVLARYFYSYRDKDLFNLLNDYKNLKFINNRQFKRGYPLCEYDLDQGLRDNKFKDFGIYIDYLREEKFLEKKIIIYASGSITYLIESQIKVENEMDFKKFPFDEQNIWVSLSSRFKNEVKLTKSKRQNDRNKFMLNNLTIPGWNVEKVTAFSDDDPKSDWFNSYLVLVEINRTHINYIIKFFIPVFFIVFISFSCFWIDKRDLKTRVELSIVCLLSLIAFNFVISGKLPDLPYITFLDTFVLISYLFAGMTTISAIIIFNLPDRKKIPGQRFVSLNDECKVWLPSAYVISNLTAWAYLWAKL